MTQRVIYSNYVGRSTASFFFIGLIYLDCLYVRAKDNIINTRTRFSPFRLFWSLWWIEFYRLCCVSNMPCALFTYSIVVHHRTADNWIIVTVLDVLNFQWMNNMFQHQRPESETLTKQKFMSVIQRTNCTDTQYSHFIQDPGHVAFV